MQGDAATRSHKPSYFLISVSTREYLDLCIRHGLAGFPSGESGAWTYCEIQVGDFVSFLYGATVYNLYSVIKREAISGADSLPPWKPLVFRETGKTYSFPFRLHLLPIRTFTESLVRSEFSYVGENLLLRGGYRKTHFQADQTTLQGVSEMGTRTESMPVELPMPEYKTFTLRFTRNPDLINTPETCRFKEPILQSAIRRHLMYAANLRKFLAPLNLRENQIDELEILGEKALPQGHIDLLLKHRVPLGAALKIPIEVKTNRGQPDDVDQLHAYMNELRGDCPGGILVASDFGKSAIRAAAEAGIGLARYTLNADLKQTPTFEEISQGVTLAPSGN
jgi:hypothetical protein